MSDRPSGRVLDIPASSAVILLDIDDQEENEFTVGDRFRHRRMFDVHLVGDGRQACIIECQCPHCCQYNDIRVTTRRGRPQGPDGMIKCQYCEMRANLFSVDAIRGRIQLFSRRTDGMVSVTMADAVKTYLDYRAKRVALPTKRLRPMTVVDGTGA